MRDCNGNEFQCSRTQWEMLYRPRRWTLVRDENGRRRRQRRSALRLWLAGWNWLAITATLAAVVVLTVFVVSAVVAPTVAGMMMLIAVIVVPCWIVLH